MEYKDRLLAHLGEYRRDVLGIPGPGVFLHRGKELPVEHVLPADQPWLTIPESTRSAVQAYCEAKGIKRHRYFHHLNSSQAFALSLFVPFFTGGVAARGALLRALGLPGALVDWEPEKVPDSDEGTNLDMWWRTTDGVHGYCEVKLTEGEFGTAKHDAAHLRKLERTYAPLLAGHVRPSRLEPEEFFASYQIFRNLWHAVREPNSRVVFLYPRQHATLSRLLTPVLADITSDLRERVIVAHAEDVLARLQTDDGCPDALRQYAGELADKFLLRLPSDGQTTHGLNGHS